MCVSIEPRPRSTESPQLTSLWYTDLLYISAELILNVWRRTLTFFHQTWASSKKGFFLFPFAAAASSSSLLPPHWLHSAAHDCKHSTGWNTPTDLLQSTHRAKTFTVLKNALHIKVKYKLCANKCLQKQDLQSSFCNLMLKTRFIIFFL